MPQTVTSTYVLWSHFWQTAWDTWALTVLWIKFQVHGVQFHPSWVLSQEQSGGAYSSLGSKASDEIFLWQSDGIFSYSSHFSSLDLGHWSKSQGDKQVARKADGRIIILTYHLLVDITSVCAWRVLSARTYVICQYTQVHKIQRSLWQVMLPLEWPVLLSAVAHGSETTRANPIPCLVANTCFSCIGVSARIQEGYTL